MHAVGCRLSAVGSWVSLRPKRHQRTTLGGTALLLLSACSTPLPAGPLCHHTTTPIHVDGLGQESVWTRARPQVLRPLNGTSESATAVCAWNERGIALYAQLTDTHLKATVTEHDGRTWDDDVIEWFLAPANQRAYVEVHVTPNGTTLDLRLPAPTDVDPRTSGDPTFALQAAVVLSGTLTPGDTDTAWSAELFLPWSDLPGGAPATGDIWTSHVARYNYPAEGPPILSSTAPFTEVDFHRRQEWNSLTFVQ